MTPFCSDIDITLRDGRTVHLRAIRSADEEELLQAFERLDPDARYMRFMRVVREANVDRLRSFLALFPESGTALVVARDLWHDCGGEDTPLSRSITELLIDAYTALDRPLLARRARARMDWVIEVDREFEERRKRREREQAEH